MGGKEQMDKTFYGDFLKFLDKIKNQEFFSLSRWGDGELSILEGNNIDLLNKGNGEFKYDKDIPKYEFYRKKLLDSYKFKDDNYYIGIACPCCVGDEKHKYMKDLSEQDEDHLTWANIFVNSNYNHFDMYLKEFNNKIINIVVNKQSDVNDLPFKTKNIWYVGKDAWVDDYKLVNEISNYINNNKIENELFLFASGPFANILTYELWKVSKKNIYIDIGTVLDPYLKLKLTRRYLLGKETIKKICVWS
jgi:hypothetical protein